MSKRNKKDWWKQYATTAGCNTNTWADKFNVDWLLAKLELGIVYESGNEYDVIAVLDGVEDFADEGTAKRVLEAKNFLREQHVD